MKKIKMIALCACPYGVGVVPKGQIFDADERDVKLLQALKRARIADDDRAATAGHSPQEADPVDASSQTSSTAAGDSVDAAGSDDQKPPAGAAEASEQPKGRRTYRRQDLRAEK